MYIYIYLYTYTYTYTSIHLYTGRQQSLALTRMPDDVRRPIFGEYAGVRPHSRGGGAKVQDAVQRASGVYRSNSRAHGLEI